MKLSKGQLDRFSEIFGNISVAWFTAGGIAPLFVNQKLVDLLPNIGVSLFMSVVFIFWSIYLMRKIKS